MRDVQAATEKSSIVSAASIPRIAEPPIAHALEAFLAARRAPETRHVRQARAGDLPLQSHVNGYANEGLTKAEHAPLARHFDAQGEPRWRRSARSWCGCAAAGRSTTRRCSASSATWTRKRRASGPNEPAGGRTCILERAGSRVAWDASRSAKRRRRAPSPLIPVCSTIRGSFPGMPRSWSPLERCAPTLAPVAARYALRPSDGMRGTARGLRS